MTTKIELPAELIDAARVDILAADAAERAARDARETADKALAETRERVQGLMFPALVRIAVAVKAAMPDAKPTEHAEAFAAACKGIDVALCADGSTLRTHNGYSVSKSNVKTAVEYRIVLTDDKGAPLSRGKVVEATAAARTGEPAKPSRGKLGKVEAELVTEQAARKTAELGKAEAEAKLKAAQVDGGVYGERIVAALRAIREYMHEATNDPGTLRADMDLLAERLVETLAAHRKAMAGTDEPKVATRKAGRK